MDDLGGKPPIFGNTHLLGVIVPKLLIGPRPLKVEVRLDATPHAPVCWAIGTVSGALFVGL